MSNDFNLPENLVSSANTLADDWQQGSFIGKVWRPGIGASVITIDSEGYAVDITNSFPTTSILFDEQNPAASVRQAIKTGERIGRLADILAATPAQDDSKLHLMTPIDLQDVKAAGVTFVESLIERMVEEAIKGDAGRAEEKRAEIKGIIAEHVGPDFSKIQAGTPEALQLLKYLVEDLGLKDTYLNVGLGKDVELFQKRNPAGHGEQAGYNHESKWTNPEPELVLAVNSRGQIIGATLGNDVNDREVEGRTPLLLSRAKNKTKTCSVGPFIRLFDKNFGMDDLRNIDVRLQVTGADGFVFDGVSSMSRISRDPVDIVAQMTGEDKYPDGAVLFLGTMTVPTKDRGEAGSGFFHKDGDMVTVSTPLLGALSNIMVGYDRVRAPQHNKFELMTNLSERGALAAYQQKSTGEQTMAPQQTAMEMLAEQAPNILAGGPEVAKPQPASAPGWAFGRQLKGLKNALLDDSALILGGGDVFPKFVVAGLDHLGIKNRTILKNKQPPEGAEQAYGKGAKCVTYDELSKTPELIEGKNFKYAIILSPPDKHLENIEQAFKLGLPVIVEKPAFVTAEEYKEFEALQKKYGIPVYFMDWEVPLAAPLFTALGHDVPFADSITYENREAFDGFDINNLRSVDARFVEGGDCPLQDALVGDRAWLSTYPTGGMLSDMGIHCLAPFAVLGFLPKEILEVVLGKGIPGRRGVFEVIGKEDVPDNKKTAERYARLVTNMSYGAQDNIPVTVEAAKSGVENDMRIDMTDKNGNILRYRFGHETSVVELIDPQGKVLAKAESKGDPYALMFVQAAEQFQQWRDSGKLREYATVAFGTEYARMIELVERAHNHARSKEVEPGTRVSQLSLNGGKIYQPHEVGKEYKVISTDHHTAEGPIFDKKSGCFLWTDITDGTLHHYDPKFAKATTWAIAGQLQTIGGTTAINQDGSVMVMLDNSSSDAGLSYFNMQAGQLINIPKSDPEAHLYHNRPNDATVMTIDGKNHLLYGTMSRDWERSQQDAEGHYKPEGAFYLLDPETLQSKRINIPADGNPYHGTVISNGLADGGDTPDGRKILYFAETVGPDSALQVYRGILDPKTLNVTDVEVFATHQALTDGAVGRPDGANMAMLNGEPVYGVAVLQTGEIRFFNTRTAALELAIKLPPCAQDVTKFAIGKDEIGKNIALVTSKTPDDATLKGEGTGSVITFELPEGLEAHPQTMGRVDYPSLVSIIEKDVPSAIVTPGNGHVRSIKPEVQRVA